MDDLGKVPYDNEQVLGGELLTVQYGSDWLPFLLAVAYLLCDESIYAVGSDSRYAVLNAQELITRLMGGTGVFLQEIAALPIALPAIGMRVVPPETTEFKWWHTGSFFDTGQHSGSADIERAFLEFKCYLNEGDYTISVIYRKAANGGVFRLEDTVGEPVSDEYYDGYSSVNLDQNRGTFSFSVMDAGLQIFRIAKFGTNAPSGQCILNLYGVIVGYAEA